MALPVGAAVLAFASVANAATVAPQVYTPTTDPELASDITAANAAPAGTESIIQLCGCFYQPAAGFTLKGNIEITGPPTYQVDPASADHYQEPQVDGSNVQGEVPETPLFTIARGANVVMKGFEVTLGGDDATIGAINIQGADTASGTVPTSLEVDNVALDGENGVALVAGSDDAVEIVNSDISDNVLSGVVGPLSAGNVTLVNDTLTDNSGAAVATSGAHLYNSIIAGNAINCENTTVVAAAGNWSDNSQCGSTGFSTDANLTEGGDLSYAYFEGGPTSVNMLTGGPAVGGGDATYCPTADQRFFLYTGGPGKGCDPGAYQTTGVQDTSTTPPACTVASIDHTSNPQSEVVNTIEADGIGLGPDAVPTAASSDGLPPASDAGGAAGLGVTTDNGTVSWPVVGSTFLDETAPTDTWAPDFPSNGVFPVTSMKPTGDTQINDTHWSYYASDWLGNTAFCH